MSHQIIDAWAGRFAYSPVWALAFLGLGVGTIAQVVVQILPQMAGSQPLGLSLANGAFAAGLFAGFIVMSGADRDDVHR